MWSNITEDTSFDYAWSDIRRDAKVSVSAIGTGGESTPAIVSLSPDVQSHLPTDELAEPSNVSVAPASSTSVTLAFNDDSAPITVEVYYWRADWHDDPSTLGTVQLASGITWDPTDPPTTITVSGLTAGAHYKFAFQAANSIGWDSPPYRQPSTVVVKDLALSETAPSAPSSLSATAFSGDDGHGINLVWDNIPKNEDHYEIERSTDGTTFNALATVGADTSSYTDATATPDTTYYYRVKAVNGAGSSSYAGGASAAVVTATATNVTIDTRVGQTKNTSTVTSSDNVAKNWKIKTITPPAGANANDVKVTGNNAHPMGGVTEVEFTFFGVAPAPGTTLVYNIELQAVGDPNLTVTLTVTIE